MAKNGLREHGLRLPPSAVVADPRNNAVLGGNQDRRKEQDAVGQHEYARARSRYIGAQYSYTQPKIGN